MRVKAREEGGREEGGREGGREKRVLVVCGGGGGGGDGGRGRGGGGIRAYVKEQSTPASHQG